MFFKRSGDGSNDSCGCLLKLVKDRAWEVSFWNKDCIYFTRSLFFIKIIIYRSPLSRNERAVALGLSASNSPSTLTQQSPQIESLRQRSSTTGNVALDFNQPKTGLESLTEVEPISLKHRGSLDIRNTNESSTPTSATHVSRLNELLQSSGSTKRDAGSISPSEASTCSTATTVRNIPEQGTVVAKEEDEEIVNSHNHDQASKSSLNQTPSATITASVALSAPPPTGIASLNGGPLATTSSASSSTTSSSAAAGTPHSFKGNFWTQNFSQRKSFTIFAANLNN